MTLTTNLSLGELGEAMAPRSVKSFPGRNRPRKKTQEIARYGAGQSGQIYSKNFCNRRKVPSLGGVGGGVRGSQEGGAPGGLLDSLEFLSGSTRAWNFPNFAKTLKS